MKKILFSMLFFILLTGCVSLPALPPRMGMTMQEVYDNYGVTLCKYSSVDQNGRVDIWAYTPNPFTGKPSGGTYDCRSATQRIHFRNGVVVAWENINR